jgi:hypothetical protein
MTKKLSDNKKQGDIYQSSDLALSAALISEGFDLVSIDKTDPKRCQFTFKKLAGIEQAADAYWSGRLRVSARLMFDNLKMLKSRLYSKQ